MERETPKKKIPSDILVFVAFFQIHFYHAPLETKKDDSMLCRFQAPHVPISTSLSDLLRFFGNHWNNLEWIWLGGIVGAALMYAINSQQPTHIEIPICVRLYTATQIIICVMARKQYYANVRKKLVFTINATHFAVCAGVRVCAREWLCIGEYEIEIKPKTQPHQKKRPQNHQRWVSCWKRQKSEMRIKGKHEAMSHEEWNERSYLSLEQKWTLSTYLTANCACAVWVAVVVRLPFLLLCAFTHIGAQSEPTTVIIKWISLKLSTTKEMNRTTKTLREQQ